MTPDRVELSARAREDLDAILSHLLERNPVAAVQLWTAIDEAFAVLAATSPRIDGRVVALRSGATCRRWLVHPVVILYERAAGVVFIVAIHHHAREPITR